MKNKWQKYTFSFCLGVGIIVGILTQTTIPTIGVAALLGIILHFIVGYFFLPED
ncbi:MAG: hypothetical protein MJ077_02915 [Oscillospiraceae bacterium]|nr:hypothetical protein [Oscillospiraceae bacterium]